MNKRSILTLLLAALLTMSAVGCGNATTDETTGTENADTNTPVETEEVVTFDSVARSYQNRDYDGYTFRIADRGSGWKTVDVYAEELTGEAINDAVYNRNTALETAMNFKIEEYRCDDAPASVLKTAVTAGTDDYDTITDGLRAVSSLVTQSMLLDWRNISTVHCEAAYWDGQLYQDCVVMGHSFFMTGDISMMDNQGTWCLMFNKDLVTDYSLENPYDLVNEGTWTLDKMAEMADAVMTDTDGDGAWTDADIYGYVTEGYNTIALWECAGFRIMENGNDGIPYFTYNSEASIDALTKILKLQYGSSSNMGSNSTVTEGGLPDKVNSRERQFGIGKALFYYAGMTNITQFRDFDTNFGIIPAPKINAEQEQYHSSYSSGNFTVYVIPTTASDSDMVGDIMDAMANLSVYTLTPAYYDQTLIGKSTRDEESEPMIELILNTRSFDLGVIFDIGSISSAITGLTSEEKIASTFASKEKTATTALDKFITDLSELQQ